MTRWVLLSLVFCAPSILADTAPAAPAPGRELTGLDEQTFLQHLVKRSVEVQYSRLNSEVTGHLMKAEAGLYETTFIFSAREDERKIQRTAAERAANITTAGTSILEEAGRVNEAGLRNKLPWGSELTLSYKPTRRTNNLIPQYNADRNDTEYNTLLNLTLKQPLLRNAGREVTETDRRVADLEHQISLHQLRQQTLKVSIDGLGLYWQLHRAEATLALRESAYANTQALINDVKARIEAGKLPASNLLDVQGVLLNREAEVTRARQAVREAQGKLATALNVNLNPDTPLGTRPRPRVQDTVVQRTSGSADQALAQWPPYQIAQLKLEQARTRLNFAHNQKLPLVDFVMSYGGTGYANQLQTARSTALRSEYRDWYVGVNMEFPLQGNQKATQQYLAQNTRMTQAELEMASIKTSFDNDLEVRYSDLVQAKSILRASHDEVTLRQTIHDNERKRFEVGIGLLGTLIQKQIELVEARQRLLENQIRFEVAWATWLYSQGDLLRTHQIEISDQPSPPQ